jgi:gas vesicle protein
MWYFIGGAFVGASVGLVTATLLITAKQLDKELEDAVKNWSNDIEI